MRQKVVDQLTLTDRAETVRELAGDNAGVLGEHTNDKYGRLRPHSDLA